MAPELSAIILAAGLSSRMGALKPLLTLGDTTLLGRCVRVLRQAGVSDILVVSGHRGEEVAAEALRHGAQPVYNPHHLQGMYSSIRAGVQALDPEARHVFLLPVDIALLRAGTPTLLAEDLHDDIQVRHPVFQGRRGHPLLIAVPLARRLTRAENPPGGLRPLLAAHEHRQPRAVQAVAVADANILFDLDTPEAYLQAQALCESYDYPSPEEAAAILRHIHPMPPRGLAHGQRVGTLAAHLATACNRARKTQLHVELCHTCGLLHDLAKGHAHHEALGAAWLRRLGFPQAAAIVAAHRDLEWHEGMPITERELVHLADKLVRGERVVSLEQRFGDKLALYAQDQAARTAIRTRYDLARRLALAVEKASGQSLAVLCATAFPPAPC